MKSLRLILAVLAAGLLSVAVYAADPTGSWKFTMQGGRGGGGGGAGGAGKGGGMEVTFKLALKDGKLTGTYTQPGRQGGAPTDIEISDASFKDDTVTFSVVREGQNGKTTTKFEGKIDGDTIKGTMLAPGRGGGEPMPREWTATKAKM